MSGLGIAIFSYTILYIPCNFGNDVQLAVKHTKGIHFRTKILAFLLIIQLERHVDGKTSRNVLVYDVKEKPISFRSSFVQSTKWCGLADGTLCWAQFWDPFRCNNAHWMPLIVFLIYLDLIFFRLPIEFIPLSWCYSKC